MNGQTNLRDLKYNQTTNQNSNSIYSNQEQNQDYLQKSDLQTETILNLSNNVLSFIVDLYFKNLTTQEASDILKKNFNISIKRNIISKIWKGEIVLEQFNQNLDYQKMINDKRQRVIRKKFTNEELDFIKLYNGSQSECRREFEKKFKKTVTREYIYYIYKLKPA